MFTFSDDDICHLIICYLSFILTDVTGKIVYRTDDLNFSGEFNRIIEVDSFAKGVYSLNINLGENSAHRKVVLK